MTFTLGHGLAASLALHGALILPFTLRFEPPPPDEPPLLVVELQGIQSDTQSEQQVQQQTKGAPEQKPQDEAQEEQKTQTAQAPSPPEPQQEATPEATVAAPPPPTPEQKAEDAPPQESATPAQAQSGTPGAANIVGAQEQKQAQTLTQEQEDQLRKLAYVRALAKKLKGNLVLPADARRTIRSRGTTRVSFTVEADGRVRAGTLKVKTSSGQPRYDAAALRTVEANAPFDPPPREMEVSVPVEYFPQ